MPSTCPRHDVVARRVYHPALGRHVWECPRCVQEQQFERMSARERSA